MNNKGLKRFPDWAPPALLLQMKRCQTILNTGKAPDILAQEAKSMGFPLDSIEFTSVRYQLALQEMIEVWITLCTHPSMINIWKRLTKKVKNGELLIDCPENGEDDYPVAFSMAVQLGLCGLSGWEKLPHGEAAIQRSEMQKTINKLADQLEQYRVVFSMFQLFTEKEFREMQRFFCGHIEHFQPQEYDIFKTPMCPVPNIPDLLRRIAGILEVSASGEFISESKFNGVPSTKNIELRFFIKTVAGHFVDFFGAPMHDTVAALGMIFFPDSSLDSRKVSSILGQ